MDKITNDIQELFAEARKHPEYIKEGLILELEAANAKILELESQNNLETFRQLKDTIDTMSWDMESLLAVNEGLKETMRHNRERRLELEAVVELLVKTHMGNPSACMCCNASTGVNKGCCDKTKCVEYWIEYSKQQAAKGGEA